MKFLATVSVLVGFLVLSGCYSEGINYSRSLFTHIPDDPNLLVLVKPNDISTLAEVAIGELKLDKFFGDKLQMNAELLEQYKNVTNDVLEAVGIPWSKVEAIGFLLYFQKPVILISGEFARETVNQKLIDIGFKQHDNGYFDYIYGGWKMSVPDNGLMMMGEEELLDDLRAVPEEHRLWNRDDFKKYRSTSPLDNSIFIWSHPPDNLLSDFKYRDDLGDVSLAMDFSGNFTMKATVRVKDPQKVVFLHDMVLGSVKVAGGYFGDDPDYGPLFKGIKVTQDNRKVEASLVISQERLRSLKARVIDDIQNPDSKTFDNLKSFMNTFQ